MDALTFIACLTAIFMAGIAYRLGYALGYASGRDDGEKIQTSQHLDDRCGWHAEREILKREIVHLERKCKPQYPINLI